MCMIRSFNPVGQGAFYTEKFLTHGYEYNFVFDCGSNTCINKSSGMGKYLEIEIDGVFNKGEEIEAVFISHCDSDHINGLDKLLSTHHVKKLFMPLIPEESKILLLMQAYVTFGYKKNQFFEDIIFDPLSLVNKEKYNVTQVILVKESTEQMLNQVDNINFFELNDNIPDEIDSGSEVLLRIYEYPIWKFVLSNFKEDERISELINAFASENIPIPKNYTDMVKIWHSHKNKIINVYKRKSKEKITGDINTNSLLVYSGKTSNINISLLSVNSTPMQNYCLYPTAGGCMYLGDYMAKGSQKWKWLKDAFSNNWQDIHIWQLPHHGSWRNYNDEMTLHSADFYVACAGYANQYHHPSGSVIRKLIMAGKSVFCVTEKVGTRIDFVYRL